MTECSNCGIEIDKLPEGVSIPEPPYEITDLVRDSDTGIMVINSAVVHAYCQRCANSVGVTLERYLKRVAK